MAFRVVRHPATIVAHLTCSRIRSCHVNEGDIGTQMVSPLRHHRAIQLWAFGKLECFSDFVGGNKTFLYCPVENSYGYLGHTVYCLRIMKTQILVKQCSVVIRLAFFKWISFWYVGIRLFCHRLSSTKINHLFEICWQFYWILVHLIPSVGGAAADAALDDSLIQI